MRCSEIAEKIEAYDPEAHALEVARLCTLMSSTQPQNSLLDDNDDFEAAWKELNLRLAAATDQHAAVTDELMDLAHSDPKDFTQDQVWVLVRAIKIQSQLIQLYVGHPEE